MYLPTLTSTFAAVALSVALASCGGGGSDGTANGDTTNIGAGSPLPGTSMAIITTAPATPSYTGEELGAYNQLNAARSTCGFGYLQQNTHIDTAASNHVSWEIANAAYGHTEVAGTTAFTGVSPGDRMLAAGYVFSGTWSYGEIIDALGSANKTGFGVAGINNLLGAHYHLVGAMSSAREMGVSVKSGGPSGADLIATAKVSHIVVNMAYTGNVLPQLQAASEVLTYPCQGITGTNWQLQGETPSPVPSRNLAISPIGIPIFVQVLQGNTLTIASASVIGPAGPVALLPTMTSANDPNKELAPHQAIIMPNVPLKPSTSYRVSISGLNSGVAFSRNFSFQTGS